MSVPLILNEAQKLRESLDGIVGGITQNCLAQSEGCKCKFCIYFQLANVTGVRDGKVKTAGTGWGGEEKRTL